MTAPLTLFDKPNSYIGRSVPRPAARRLVEGRGQLVPVDATSGPGLQEAGVGIVFGFQT